MSKDMLKYLADKISEEHNRMADDLALGKAKDFGDYKYACGIIRGLMMTTNIIMETAERMDNDDD
jgi:hypothetical protein